MKRIRYTKFTGDLASSFGLEDLMQALSDFLLDSGYQDPYAQFSEFNNQTMENLREAIRQALESGELFDEESQQKFDELSADQVEELIDQIIEKMQEENFINAEAARGRPRAAGRWQRRGALRSHRQEHGLPGLQGAARVAGAAGEIQHRAA